MSLKAIKTGIGGGFKAVNNTNSGTFIFKLLSPTYPTTFSGGAFETTDSVSTCGGFRYPFSTTATLNPEATSFCDATYVEADFSQLTPQYYDGWGGVFRVNGVSFKRLGYFSNGMTRFTFADTNYYPCTAISC
jgi:hypothetical protein